MEKIISTENLKKTFSPGKNNEIPVLKGITLNINRGEFITVMGPSGSGKSTLLYCISGMDRPSSGSVHFCGTELSAATEKELASLRLRRMGFVFQNFHLLKNLNLLDNIILPASLSEKRGRSGADGRKSSGEILRRAGELMEKTGIASLAENAISQVSGGQLQRAAICRALINEPEIIFGDEPTGALNSSSASEIMGLISEINREGTTVMIVTHDPRVAAQSERILFMIDGEIAGEKRLGKFTGKTENIKKREEELESWLSGLGF